jgi:hypothetical protein
LDTVAIIVAFPIAIAQALTILFTVRQEKDIKELSRLVDGQRLQIVELKAWLARRNTGPPRFARSEREPTSLRAALKRAAPSQPAITPKGLPNTEDELLERTTNVINWLNRVAIDYTARRNSGLRRWGMPPPPSTGAPPVTNIRNDAMDQNRTYPTMPAYSAD